MLLLAACGGGSDPLADDPNGARACDSLAQAFQDKDDQDAAVAGALEAGEAAEQSTTEAISSTVNDVAGMPLADAQQLRDACVDAGVDMPEVPS